MTPQEIFDKSVSGVIQQGCAAVGPGDMCVYRKVSKVDQRVTKCAVGQLIPEEVYSPHMEGSVSNLVHNYDSVLPKYFNTNMALLQDLQNAHDEANSMSSIADGPIGTTFVEYFERAAKRVARKHDLVWAF